MKTAEAIVFETTEREIAKLEESAEIVDVTGAVDDRTLSEIIRLKARPFFRGFS